jgi:ABC-type glycerol-3-phosphate transport system substrate-binding protein
VPKKAVAIFFLLAFLGAALFVYFTFPRTKDQIPTSNNQRPFPSAPEPSGPSTPNGVPVPETVPHPNTPKVPPGPTLRVMAWASAPEARHLSAEADAFGAATGRQVSLTIAGNQLNYRRDLQQALASDAPPDVCLISSRDFCGLDPAQDLADATPVDTTPPRAVAAFTVDGKIKAVPDEFSVEVLFYNPAQFDQAGIAYPDRHWNWDILEADARAITSLHIKDPTGHPTYALELTPDFDLWNILCTEAGHPVLDLDTWHLTDTDTKESQMRGLDLIHELFQQLAVTAPPEKATDPSGHLFAQQRASMLIAPSDVAASLPASFHYGMTLFPRDVIPASLAHVNGWAITAKSSETNAALILAQYLAARPVHAGWTSMQPPAAGDTSPAAICHEELQESLLPRLDSKGARLAQYLNQQVSALAYNSQQTPDALFPKIQAQYQVATGTSIHGGLPTAAAPSPAPKVDASSQLRGL